MFPNLPVSGQLRAFLWYRRPLGFQPCTNSSQTTTADGRIGEISLVYSSVINAKLGLELTS